VGLVAMHVCSGTGKRLSRDRRRLWSAPKPPDSFALRRHALFQRDDRGPVAQLSARTTFLQLRIAVRLRDATTLTCCNIDT
jgi:hypothetical protein